MTQSGQFCLTLLDPKIDKNKAYSVNNAVMKAWLEQDTIVDFLKKYISSLKSLGVGLILVFFSDDTTVRLHSQLHTISDHLRPFSTSVLSYLQSVPATFLPYRVDV